MAISLKNDIHKDGADLTTFMPAPVLNDLKHRLAPLYGGTLIKMYDTMIRAFFREEPWLHGLKWRETQALSRREETIERVRVGDGSALETPVTTTVATGWVQVNMRLEPELAERVKAVADTNGVSPSTVLYTAVYYWIWYKNPTPEIEKIRKTRHEQWKAKGKDQGDDPDAEDVTVTPRRPGPGPDSGSQDTSL